MLVSEFFEDFYRPLRLRGRSPRTVLLYHNTIKQYEKWLGRRAVLEDDLNDLQVSRYLEHRATIRSPLTSEKERSQLCALWRCASDRRLIDLRPTVLPTIRTARVPTCWTEEQLRSLVAAAKATPGLIGDVPARIWWPALILALFQSAERIGAMLSAKKEDYVRPRILMLAEYRKGGRSDKLHTFTESTCELLDILKKSKNGPRLFGWPQDYGYLWARFGKIVDAAGLEGGRRNKFHNLRRSAATHYKKRGGDPTELLDHSSPRVTKAYLDPRILYDGPAACDVLPDIAS